MKPEITDVGICLTPCPYGVNANVGSMACELCDYYFGYENGTIKCTGYRLVKESA